MFDPIPSLCHCGGQIEYSHSSHGEEMYACKKCNETFHRYTDTLGGG